MNKQRLSGFKNCQLIPLLNLNWFSSTNFIRTKLWYFLLTFHRCWWKTVIVQQSLLAICKVARIKKIITVANCCLLKSRNHEWAWINYNIFYRSPIFTRRSLKKTFFLNTIRYACEELIQSYKQDICLTSHEK